MGTSHFSGLNLKITAIGEAAAGEFEIVGLATDDVLLAVAGFKLTLGEASPNTIAFTMLDLTSEFSITGVNTIDNTGGTSLADSVAFVFWLDIDAA